MGIREVSRAEDTRRYRARHREKVLAAGRAQYARDREKRAAAAKKKRLEHPELVRAKDAAWRTKNKEKIAAAKKRWREKHADRIREAQRIERSTDAYRVKTRDRYAKNRSRILLQKAMNRYRIAESDIARFMAAQGGTCAGCREPFEKTPRTLTTTTRQVASVGCYAAIAIEPLA